MNCDSPELRRFLDFGMQPNGNCFPWPDEKGAEPLFPFAMMVCRSCWQVQIEEFPSPEFMFSNHPYITGVNVPVVDYFHRMAAKVVERYALKAGDLILDIGCNDGTLLGIFKQYGLETIGVDPGKRTGVLAKKAGIEVIGKFWGQEVAREFRLLGKRPRIITATSVFFHLQDIHDFIRVVREVMEQDTVFIVQCVYLKEVIEKNQFDHFYHEHTMIHAIAPLEALFERYGMRMLQVDYYDVHGGSFVLEVARKESAYPARSSIREAIEEEAKCGLRQIETYEAFARRIALKRGKLLALLRRLRSEGRIIDALGAPVKGSTLMNYCGIGPDLIRCAVEVNEFKIGRLTPGTHIPIVDEREARNPPDYYLVLAWNFLDFFRKKYEGYLKKGGRFIVPHPEVHCVGIE